MQIPLGDKAEIRSRQSPCLEINKMTDLSLHPDQQLFIIVEVGLVVFGRKLLYFLTAWPGDGKELFHGCKDRSIGKKVFVLR